MTDDLPLLLGGSLALLALASTIVFGLGRGSRRMDVATIENIRARVRSWWVMSVVFGLVLVLGKAAATLLFALVSFQALREFLTISPSRRSDHAPMHLSFFGFLPLQYLLVGIGWYGLFLVLIPVYGFILLPVRKVLVGDTEEFLHGAARTQWALMLCVYCLSHLPLLLLLPLRNWDKSNVQLLFFLVFTAQLSDVLQYVFGKLCGRRPIAPRLSPHKTWEGFVGGVLTASAVATGLWWATPFAPWQAALLALMICLFGFAGGLVLSAIKRDLGAKDWGQGIAGHGGVLDRVDSLVFSAPLFFHLCGFFFGSGFDPSPPDWLASLVGR